MPLNAKFVISTLLLWSFTLFFGNNYKRGKLLIWLSLFSVHTNLLKFFYFHCNKKLQSWNCVNAVLCIFLILKLCYFYPYCYFRFILLYFLKLVMKFLVPRAQAYIHITLQFVLMLWTLKSGLDTASFRNSNFSIHCYLFLNTNK